MKTSVRFAPTRALLLYVQPPSSVCPESRVRVALKRIPLGSFLYPFGALRVGFQSSDVESSDFRGCACAVICSTLSDRIISTLPALRTRAAVVNSRMALNMYKIPVMVKVRVLCCAHFLNRFRVSKGYTRTIYIIFTVFHRRQVCYEHLLNQFSVSKGYTHVQYIIYCVLHCP